MSNVTEYDFSDEALVEGELQLFRTLWHTSNDNLFIVRRDANGDYISEKTNRSMELTFNILAGDIDGVALRDLMDENSYKNVSERYERCINTNKPINYEEKHIIDESGERFWITTIVPAVSKDSDVVRIFGVSKEVTEIRNIQKKLQESNDKLELQVQERTKELTDALDRMEILSTTDNLTDLYNRYKIEDILQNEINRAQRYDRYFGLLILDIDHFKDVNDKHGHIQGDKILREFANILRTYTRECDSVGRWSGKEFLVIIPESTEESILNFANRLRNAIKNHEFKTVGKVTVSIGTTLYEKGSTSESLILKAVSALYICKNNGRDNVSITF